MVRTLASLPGAVLDLLLPPLCLGCQASVGQQGALCPGCWQNINFLSPPWCDRCGLPFELPPDAAAGPALCAECIRRPPAFDQARAALVYDAGSRPLILSFKHGDRTEAAGPMGRWMARAGVDFLEKADHVIPVPLHRWRLWRRRYNQSALLARALARPGQFVPDMLVRHRATASQGLFSLRGRQRNVARAFTVRPAWRTHLAGKTIVLVDDVLTTGATLQECARTLKAAGTACVHVLTLARVVRK
ncbi:MAG: ComF family protein [Pseudomonadota bacterium]|nr:ComF family protein [Pseudomonadota bacterium]